MRNYTPEEYVLASVNCYPSLYSAKTFEQAKLRVYDQLFNVIGNGISDNDEIKEALQYSDFDRARAIRFCNGEPAYYGYYKAKSFGDIAFGEGNSITVGEWEKVDHPDIVHWMECGYCDWRPYPNFKKKYSIIWQSNFRKIAGPEWVKEGVWYYEKCLEWINSDESCEYHGAYPTGDQHKDARYLQDMMTQYSKYGSDEEFSEAYGLEYTGDMIDFMERRWQQEKEKIKQFINETIEEFSK